MQVCEPGRLLLIRKREEVSPLTDEIFEIAASVATSRDDVLLVKGKMVRILLLLNTPKGYGHPGRDRGLPASGPPRGPAGQITGFSQGERSLRPPRGAIRSGGRPRSSPD
jgi:hypothetical protein